MTASFRTYRPIADDDLQTPEAQFAFALGAALRWQLWLFFPPNAFGWRGAAMPCDDLPRRPPSDAADTLWVAINAVVQQSPADELIVALERRGGPDPTITDRQWMRAVADAADRAGVRLRSVLISHTRGVREHEPLAPTLPDSAGDQAGARNAITTPHSDVVARARRANRSAAERRRRLE